jgi:hypothetical protein
MAVQRIGDKYLETLDLLSIFPPGEFSIKFVISSDILNTAMTEDEYSIEGYWTKSTTSSDLLVRKGQRYSSPLPHNARKAGFGSEP